MEKAVLFVGFRNLFSSWFYHPEKKQAVPVL
jgi:hypothetical protein